MTDNTIPQRDADDAKADDGPPTDAASDEVKADSAADALNGSTGADTDASSDEEIADSAARVDEPTG
ncbi:hypothetical protein ACFXP7_08620 [Microbacterium sp. P06]|uniref:hypothetical protein n=1 Tax=unclassified Microbacterium TaxID=2609290 RepID=UPI00374760FC